MLPEQRARLGSYELHEQIGQGGFSRVHRVQRDGRDYAAKILSVDADAPDPDAVARFEREIEVLAGVSHPHLIELVDSGVDPTRGPYLVTPLIVGMTLRDLADRRPLPPESALLLIEPVVAAVAAMHAAGLVHRDLKPDNVMVTPTGDVVLVDLGLALSEAHSRLTKSGTVTGSVPYMSPEQISAEPLGPTSDVWSLGVTLYELVAGRRPFARERPSEELAAILASDPEPIGAQDRRASEDLEGLLARCLRRPPAERFASAAELHGAVLACIDHCDPAKLREERGRVIADPTGYVERCADERVAALKEAAEARIHRGDSFGALRLLDRALAYRPDDEAVLELVVKASESAPPEQSASVRSAARKLFGEHGPPASVDGFVDWVEKRLTDGLSSRPPALEPPSEPGEDAPVESAVRATPPRRRDATGLVFALLGLGGVLFLGLLFVVAIIAALR